mgnify:CR=1 FL=1
MEVKRDKKNGFSVIQLSGKFQGMHLGASLADKASSEIQDGIRFAGIDFSNVENMDSAALGVLIAIRKQFENVDGELILINPSESIVKILQITKLYEIFLISDTEEEALKIIKNVQNP